MAMTSCPNQLQSQSSPGGLGGATGDGKFLEGKLRCVCYSSVAAYNVHSGMDTCTCMCSSAHSCWCVADGGDAMAAF